MLGRDKIIVTYEYFLPNYIQINHYRRTVYHPVTILEASLTYKTPIYLKMTQNAQISTQMTR